jgi:hypothetical protein
VLPVKHYEALLEELEDIQLYNEAKKSNEKSMDAVKAFKQIDQKRSQSQK